MIDLPGVTMHETSDIPPELLSLLYATVTDRSKWQEFCDSLSQHTSERILLFGHNITQNDSLGIIASGVEQDQLDVYHQYFADKNPWMHMNVTMNAGDVGVSDAALRREDLFKTEFYNDWLRPQENIVAGPAMMCYRTPDRFVAMAAACRARHIDTSLQATEVLFQQLAPHMVNAISMASILRADGLTTFAHLDGCRHAIFIVRRSGQVGYMNPAAQQFLASTPVMYLNGGDRLGAATPELTHFLRSSEAAMAENRLDEPAQPFVLGGRTYGPYMIHSHIFPAESDHRFPCSAWSDPAVGAFVVAGHTPVADAVSYDRLVQAFGATPAETRLANAVMDGFSLKDYADQTGLSLHTARNQMRALLHKTGTRNQADFVRLLASLVSPFDIENG